MARFLFFLAGLVLLPLTVAATRSVGALVLSLQDASPLAWPPGAWALAAGMGLWMLLYLVLPRPLRSYVLAHELTHVLWAWLLGVGARDLKVSAQGGSVRVGRSHVLIALAPYFFPFYTVCVLLALALVSAFADPSGYHLFWMALLGVSWGFHVTFTISVLSTRQSDIDAYGSLFSYTFIVLMNVLGIGLWIVAGGPVTLETYVHRLGADLAWTAGGLETAAVWAWDALGLP